ncbi:MAG TPA: hypothetical protein PKO21_06140 [Verrucomicrobiota bacterium]|nr:hypothetical protein [Verrucomicrobiota bacterium]
MKTKLVTPLAIAAAASLAASISQAQITDDLVVHMTFDGKSISGSYSNTVSNGIEGYPVGTPVEGPGKLGQCVVLAVDGPNGINNYVTLGYPAELMFGAVSDSSATDFSIAFWCNYTNQVSDPCFIGSQNWVNSQNPGWGIYMQGSGNMRIVTKDDSGDGSHRTDTTVGNPAGMLRDGTWHHVVVTWGRQGNMSVYKDGALVSVVSVAATTGLIDTFGIGQAVNIGQDGTGYYQGADFNYKDLQFDDLGIWRRELSAGEVNQIYVYGNGGTNISLVPTIVDPYVKSTVPGFNAAAVNPSTPVVVTIMDGANTLANASVVLTINGSEVPVSITKTGAESTVTYTPTGLWPAGPSTATIVFSGSGPSPVFVTNTWQFTVAPFITLTPAMKVTPDPLKPGFQWNVFANSANTVNTSARAEAALAGQLKDPLDGVTPLPNNADPNAQGAAIAPASPASPGNAPIKFEIAGPLNLDAASAGTGNFVPDGQMPGVPAVDAMTDGIAAEAITYISLPAGLVIMGINSDDGFKTTAGLVPQDVLGGVKAAEFEGARAPANTLFYLSVQEAGVYGFRTLYENGTGGAAIEWFTVNSGTNVLVNDTANGGYASYRAATTPTPPYVKYANPTPVPRQVHDLSRSLTLVLSDGTTALNDNSVVLKLDGNVVTPARVRSGSTLTLTYTPAGLQFPGDRHLAELSFSNVGGSYSVTNRWSFFGLQNILLPSPVLTENFDAYTEGTVPTGWTEWNFTDCSDTYCDVPGANLDDLTSDTYKGWVVVSRARLEVLKGRIFQVAPGQTNNGAEVTLDDLSTGNVIYAESDTRDGNQVQFITSSAYDLSAVANPAISLSSLYEQNQDSTGTLEYSVDGGNTWLPVFIYLDQVDDGGDIILNPDGTVDAIATLTGLNDDTAMWVDNSVPKGGKYGDALAGPVTPALGRFILPRNNDDQLADKRLEIYRLPAASHKSDVRLRFAQLGTGSWYWGVDNIRFYDVAAAPAPALSIVPGVGSVTLYWTGNGTLLSAPTVNGPWAPATSQANPQTVITSNTSTFWRIGPP